MSGVCLEAFSRTSSKLISARGDDKGDCYITVSVRCDSLLAGIENSPFSVIFGKIIEGKPVCPNNLCWALVVDLGGGALNSCLADGITVVALAVGDFPTLCLE